MFTCELIIMFVLLIIFDVMNKCAELNNSFFFFFLSTTIYPFAQNVNANWNTQHPDVMVVQNLVYMSF